MDYMKNLFTVCFVIIGLISFGQNNNNLLQLKNDIDRAGEIIFNDSLTDEPGVSISLLSRIKGKDLVVHLEMKDSEEIKGGEELITTSAKFYLYAILALSVKDSNSVDNLLQTDIGNLVFKLYAISPSYKRESIELYLTKEDFDSLNYPFSEYEIVSKMKPRNYYSDH